MESLFLGVIVAILGWLALNFIGNPLSRFWQLRRELENARQSAMRLPLPLRPQLAHMSGGDEHERTLQDLRDAAEEIRRVSNEIISLGRAERAAQAMSLLGLNPMTIGECGHVFANSLEGDPLQRLRKFEALGKALQTA